MVLTGKEPFECAAMQQLAGRFGYKRLLNALDVNVNVVGLGSDKRREQPENSKKYFSLCSSEIE